MKKDNKNQGVPALNQQVASQLLENVFDACDMERNTIPLEVLTSYSNYRRERFALQKLVLIVMMALFCLLPLMFIAPRFSLELAEDSSRSAPEYEVEVANWFPPIRRVTADIEGQHVPVYETDTHLYSIEPAKNGTMTVTVVLANGQYLSQKTEVTGVDREPPTLVSHHQENGFLYLQFQDGSGSGVDAASAYALDETGSKILPHAQTTADGDTILIFPNVSMNIFVPDYAENTMQLVLTVKDTEGP